MTKHTYPYQAWVLMPSFRPVEVTMKAAYASWSDDDYGDVTVAGKIYQRQEIFDTQLDAVLAGWKSVKRQEADINKKLANLEKKKAALRKAGGAP